ncbi:MAG TPA: hypothetical protein VLA24_10845 [Pseudomonadales bacterium]|nr:hypothetical protein [Pseudomonadales bacterium]
MQPAPHLNSDEWQHLEQTVKMLYLAIAQIETALGEGNQEAGIIGEAFSQISQHSQALRAQGNHDDTCNVIDQHVMQAVTAFQFYDRMSQRVDHVQGGLRRLIEVMESEDDLHDPNVWQKIQDEIKSSYTMEAERLMFDKIMQGISLEEALEIFRHNFRGHDKTEEDDDGDIVELF